jgi:predicted permease
MAIFPRLANLFRRSMIDREISDELQAHIDLRTDANIAAGMPPDEARRNALLYFGNPTVTKEHVTAADAALGLAGFGRDIHYSLRQLRRSPGFALTAILTLAFGIGANVIVFGVLNALILRPLDLPHVDRLVQIEQQQSGYITQSYPDYLDFRARNSAFSDLAAFRIDGAGLTAGGTAQQCWIYEISGNYFDILGVQPALGRLLHQSDEHGPESAPYIVLSDAFWRTRFNADPNVVGTTVEINKHPFTIIGVTPRKFNGTELFFWPDFFLPMVNETQVEGYSYLTKRGNHGIYVLGMMKPGVTTRQATENVVAVAHQLTRENPTLDDGLGARITKPGLMGDLLGGPARPFLAVTMILALLVLIAACVNLAGIFAARSADCARELAIRLSIGSSRWRLLRQVLTEAVLISVIGGLGGTAFAALLLNALTRWQPISEYPIHVTVNPDVRVFALALLLSLVSGILPGLLPARQIWKTNAMQAMKSCAATSPLLRRFTIGDILLGIQITLCALLVTASLVSLRGMQRSLHAPLGFNPQNAMLAIEDLHMAGYSDDSAYPIQRRIIDETARIPGITAVGTIDNAILSGGSDDSDVYQEGTADLRPSNSVTDARDFTISPGYFAATQSRLLAGRDFSWDDGPTSPKVAIINQTLARRLFGAAPALGRHFMERDKTLYQIVGIVEDGKYQSLTEDPTAAMFFPLAQHHDGSTVVVVRSQLSPAETASALNRILSGIDSSLPIVLRTWNDNLALVLFPARVATAALGVMGLLAAMLAVTGVFGMAAYSVSRRLRELGIRIALGAHRAQLVRAALGRPLLVLLSGSVAGLILGVLASRLLSALVYEASSRDPLVLLGAIAAMAGIGLIATWIPAHRALSVNPAQLLRED